MITCQFENGKPANLRHACANAILLNTERDSILLARRAPGMVGGGKWCIPGGYMELDQRAVETAQTEIREETGYDAEPLGLVCISDVHERDDNGRQNIVFVFAFLAKERIAEADAESTEQKWFPLDALPSKEEVAFDHLDIITHYRTHGVLPVPLSALFIQKDILTT